jgi:hypothetical protein
MEQHTVEVTFEGEEVSRVTDGAGITTLYRTPEGTYFVHMDSRNVTEEHARIVGRNAELDVGCFPKGHTEDFARRWWPDLFAAHSSR